MTQPSVTDAPAPWRGLTAERYAAIVEAGLLDDAPVELLEGVLAGITPPGIEHEDVIDVLNRNLSRALPDPETVRPQLGLAATPTTAALVVEVAVSSQREDLGVKARVYAQAAVTAYWVVDVPRREVVVHTDPRPDGYADVRRQPWREPLAVPVGDGIAVDLGT